MSFSSDGGLQAAFDAARCLPERRPIFESLGRHWVLEVHPWSSHRLATTITAILLRDLIGYRVAFNPTENPRGLYERLQKVYQEEEVAHALLRRGENFGYANMEVWNTRIEASPSVAMIDAGAIGYHGYSGWWVSEGFGRNESYALPPEFYRAYDVRHPGNLPLWDALRNTSNVSCSPRCCCADCARSCIACDEVHWCPSGHGGQVLPAVLAMPGVDEGFNEEIAQSHGFRFGLRYLRPRRYAQLAMEALSTGAPAIVHMWHPSQLYTRLRLLQIPVLRLTLPRDQCVSDGLDAPHWSCDFPEQEMRKFLSMDANADSVAMNFFSQFALRQRQRSGRRGPVPGGTSSLEGAGMEELLGALLGQQQGEERPSDQDVVRVACTWILDNEAEWSTWAKPREVPFYADTLSSWYPFPSLAALLLLAVGAMTLLENACLSTTLSVKEWRRILNKNGAVWRSDVELKLRKNLGDSPVSPASAQSASPRRNMAGASQAQVSLKDWEGLAEKSLRRASEFWNRADRWVTEARQWRTPPDAGQPDTGQASFVSFAHHTFPCFQHSKEAVVFLRRSRQESGLEVEVVVEASEGGAKADKDFYPQSHAVVFLPGQNEAVLRIPVVHHQDCWQNSYWFQARLGSLRGPGPMAVKAAPAKATIWVFDEDTWPANIPAHMRTGQGISLMRYFIKADRSRRGEKWTKTMIAMVFLPVHSVLVSTLVQKTLVDHAIGRLIGLNSTWGYLECLLLVLLQLLSLGLNRWADVVQTRNRGRTGGIRQAHRSDMIRKFMHLERNEYWEASDADWLYAAIYDVDIITGKAYFQVFVLAQSCFALLLSVLLVTGLAVWSYLEQATDGASAFVGVQTAWYVTGVLAMIVAGFFGVWIRMKIIWVAVLARKKQECRWFKSCVWVFTSWRQFTGLMQSEKAKIEARVQSQNAAFVPAHWDARDAMNDTAWITHWIQGVAYCLMLAFGSFALAEYQTYGIGAMEVGTFYALCKIYLSVGKYIGRLSNTFVNMQQAIVSLRDVAALLNQTCQRSQRQEAVRLSRLRSYKSRPGTLSGILRFQDNLCFMRPEHFKVGSTFSELRLRKGCCLPLGRAIHVSARNERVLRSFLGLAAQVILPTGPLGEEASLKTPSVLVPPGLTLKMLPTVPVTFGTGPSTLEQLSFTGAPVELCEALLAAVGLDKDREPQSLGPGSSQVFSICRALLVDPDVLCAFRPLALVPLDVKPQIATLLRLWQGGGGLPGIAAALGFAMDSEVHRPKARTLILGNSAGELPKLPALDEHLDLDAILWCDAFSPRARAVESEESVPSSSPRNQSQVLSPMGCCLGRSLRLP